MGSSQSKQQKPKTILLDYIFLENAIHIIGIDSVLIFFKNVIYFCSLFLILALIGKFYNCADYLIQIINFFVTNLGSQSQQIFIQIQQQFQPFLICIQKEVLDAKNDKVFLAVLFILQVFIIGGFIVYLLTAFWRYVSKWIIITEAAKKDSSAKSILGFKIFNLIFGTILWIVAGFLVYHFVSKMANSFKSSHPVTPSQIPTTNTLLPAPSKVLSDS
jgi:hypothetical protein